MAEDVKHHKGNLVLATVATHRPEDALQEYTAVFRDLSVEMIDAVDVRTRGDGFKEEHIAKLRDNSVVFFTGGDQLRITSQMGASPLYQRMIDIFHRGATIVGTSAGAAAIPVTMLVGGPGDESADSGRLIMALGLGLLPDIVIDSHFAQRGRIGRLLGTIALNPENLGIGIDEDTAIIVERGQSVQVIGSGAVYVVDGRAISYSSLSEQTAEGLISLYNVKLHVLANSDSFDLTTRLPAQRQSAASER